MKWNKLVSALMSFAITVSVFYGLIAFQTESVKASTLVSRVVVNGEGKGYLEVDGEPFFMGHVQNCGTQQLLSTTPYNVFPTPLPTSWLENSFEKTQMLGFKTISIILKWRDFEPTSPGVYDWDIIDQYVDWANEYDLRIDFAWFGSNSGGGTRLPGGDQGFAYNVPEYLHDREKYFGASLFPQLNAPYIVNGGPHDADAQYLDDMEYNAILNLFNHLAEYDTNHRTILFQAFNEPDFHPTWSTDLTNHLARIDNLAKAVKDSDYVVATRVNLATVGTGYDQDVVDLPHVDFVGHDPYTTSVSTIEDYITANISPLPYIAENAASFDNTTSLALTAITNGGYYDLWPLNDHWGAWGMNDYNGADTFVNWTLGVTPLWSFAGTDMKNLNFAMNKIDNLITLAPPSRMLGFNIGTDTPAGTYDSGIQTLGDYGIGFETTDGSVGLALREDTNVYLLSDTDNPRPLNLAYGKTAAMSTSSLSGHGADQAIDGAPWTYAQSDNNSPWSLTIDLGSSTSFNRVEFVPDITNYLTDYKVETSTDNVNWTQQGEAIGSLALTRVYDFPAVNARYVRIHGYGVEGGDTGYGHAIRDVRVYNTNVKNNSTVTFTTDQKPLAVTVGYMDNGVWVREGKRSFTDNGDGTYSIAYNTQEVLRVQFPIYYKIKNRQTGGYLHIENSTGKVEAGAINPGWWSAQWGLEYVDGIYIMLKNRQTGEYIHIEDNLGYAQYAAVLPDQWSAQWKLETVSGTYQTINNRWKSNQYLHLENNLGYAESTTTVPGWWSEQWALELVP